MKTKLFSLITFKFILIHTISLHIWAGTVTKVSDEKIIVDFNGESVPVINDKVVILDQSTHKEVGTIVILKTKDSRALGKLVNGSAKPGDATDVVSKVKKEEDRIPAEQSSREALESVPSGRRRKKISRKSFSFGAGADFVYTYVNLKSTGSSGSLDGNGFGLSGYIDYSLNPSWVLQGRVGWHPFNMQSTAQSQTIPTITTTYLAMGGIARYAFNSIASEGLWMGGGLEYFLNMSSNVSPKTNELGFVASTGYNMKLSLNYFTLKGDFIMFQPKNSSGVSFQAMQFILGGIYFF